MPLGGHFLFWQRLITYTNYPPSLEKPAGEHTVQQRGFSLMWYTFNKHVQHAPCTMHLYSFDFDNGALRQVFQLPTLSAKEDFDSSARECFQSFQILSSHHCHERSSFERCSQGMEERATLFGSFGACESKVKNCQHGVTRSHKEA
jgi:hypothetical protein